MTDTDRDLNDDTPAFLVAATISVWALAGLAVWLWRDLLDDDPAEFVIRCTLTAVAAIGATATLAMFALMSIRRAARR